MSYCRMGEMGSDFYIYTDGQSIHVYGPGTYTVFPVGEEQRLIDVLEAATADGHFVPEKVFDRLKAERDGEPYLTDVQLALRDMGL